MPPVKADDSVQLQCSSLAFGGQAGICCSLQTASRSRCCSHTHRVQGVCKHVSGFTIFVEGALPGWAGEARVTEVKPGKLQRLSCEQA